MTNRRLIVLAAALLIAGCGGGSGSPAGTGAGNPAVGSGPNLPFNTSANDTTQNTTMIGELNLLRSQCGPTSTTLPAATPVSSLMVSSTRHAGYQALSDAKHGTISLDHGEPDTAINLYSNDDFLMRIENANGGSLLPSANEYYEDIASQAGVQAIDSLWNTVFHRVPMMRNSVTSVGYGDMAMARVDYPTAGIPSVDAWGNTPSGNGYATLDFAGYPTPSVVFSYWPVTGTTGVAKVFHSNEESPDPIPPSDSPDVGPPLHAIFPAMLNFTSVTVSFAQGGTHLPVFVMVGGTTVPTAHGDATAGQTVISAELNAGEVFVIPLSPLAATTTYTYSITTVDSSTAIMSVSSSSFTTGP